jgi:hypothetical protein
MKACKYAYGPAKRPHGGRQRRLVLFIAFESPVDAVPVEDKRE